MSEVLSSKIVGIEEMFGMGCFVPAAVQRDFQWREPQSEQMLKDVLDAMSFAHADGPFAFSEDADQPADERVAGDELDAGGCSEGDDALGGGGVISGVSHEMADAPEPLPAFFLGSIILCPSEDDVFEIFDGLQRITTLTILLAILRDRTSDASLRARLARLISTDQGIFRLQHRGEKQVLPTMVQPAGEASKVRRRRPEWAAGQRIFDVARQLRNSLPHDPARISNIANFLLTYVRVSIVLISNRRLARQTFVATNLYGVPLNRSDVFRGELLELGRDADEVAEMGSLWAQICDKVSAIERNRDSQAHAGQASRFEHFLMCCDMIERRRPQSADFLGDLVGHLSKRADKGTLIEWLVSVDQFADAWVELETVMREPQLGKPLDRAIWTLNFFKWQEWRPLALYWMAQHRNGARLSTSERRFDLLSKRCLAITLLELDQARRSDMFRKALMLVLRGGLPLDNTRKRRPLNFSNSYRMRVRDALRLPIEHYEVRRSLMLWYEASLWSDDPPVYIRSSSVEHILPGRCGAGSEWLKDFSDSKKRYIHHASLGNFAMVDMALQLPLANLDFAVRDGKKAKLREAGQFGKYKTLDGVERISDWLPAVIGNRTAEAAKHIWSQLELPEPR